MPIVVNGRLAPPPRKPVEPEEQASPETIDAKALPDAEGAGLKWLTFILLIAWIVRLTLFQRGRSEVTTVDAYAIIQIALTLLVAVAVAINQRTLQVLRCVAPTSAGTVLFFYAVCAISMLWSAFPQYSGYRSAEFVILYMGVLVAFSYPRNLKSAENYLSVFVLLISALQMASYFRNGIPASFYKLHTNGYTCGGAMLFVYCLGEYFRKSNQERSRQVIPGALALFFLLMGTSTASFASAAGGIMMIAVLQRNGKMLAGGAALALALTVLLSTGIVNPESAEDLLAGGEGKIEKLQGLSGREHIWSTMWQFFLQSPIFGHGFVVMSSPGGKVYEIQPHNSVMSAAVSIGIVGVLIIAWFLAKTAREVLATAPKDLPGAVGAGTAIAVGFVNSLSNPFFFDQFEESSMQMSAFIAVFIFYVVIPYRQRAASEAQPSGERNLLRARKPALRTQGSIANLRRA